MTGIEWTDKAWNPTVGCARVSAGCDHCYAARHAHRGLTPAHRDLTLVGEGGIDWNGQVRCLPERLTDPLAWHKPRLVFVGSMSDLFHPAVADDFIVDVLAVIAATPRHSYQLLTKRPRRMAQLLRDVCQCGDRHPSGFHLQDRVAAAGRRLGLDTETIAARTWPLSNLWAGTSIENQHWANGRIGHLLDTPAAVRWVSAEPLLGPVDLARAVCEARQDGRDAGTGRGLPRRFAHADRCCTRALGSGLHWVVTGGESGPGARPMHPDWPRTLRDQCNQAKVAFLFKQWGVWAPAPWQVHADITPEATSEEAAGAKGRAEAVGATHAVRSDTGYFLELGHKTWSLERRGPAPEPWAGLRRVGKKAAGRELDGRTWHQFPPCAKTAASPEEVSDG